MNQIELEKQFMDSSPEAQKRFLKHNMRKLAKKNLLGKFYRLYAKSNNSKPIQKPVNDDPYQVLFEPLAHTIGGDLDEN